ncbi:hypothetical protein LRH25_22275 [Ideonella azotifigens]|uniref:Chromosome partition protein Smc n=1 Tax=Ideonella azotifigens TaxID=513160 RepID=A0ABN1KC19_9BURK|nr:hypothetical protein [Ideonella azotifigens]MCD2343060.1 hypothetical protein [Ideonella azotifigens]
MHSFQKHSLAGAAGLLLALVASLAAAQDKLQSLGNANAKASVMSREELRACFKEQDSIKAASIDLGTKRTALDAERKQLETENEAMKQQRDALAARVNQNAADMNARVAAHSAKVEAFNQKMDALNAAAKKGENIDRRQQVLEREGKEIQKTSDELNEAGKVFQASVDEDKNKLDSQFQQFQVKTDQWNTRNHDMDVAAANYDADLSSWKTRCGGRNYRESDEKAIRAGK